MELELPSLAPLRGPSRALEASAELEEERAARPLGLDRMAAVSPQVGARSRK
jgi:hypothetical protein